MNRSEPVIHDVDLAVDARIADETAQVDWDAVTTEEASGFGLALGLYREMVHTHEKRYTAWGTCLGGALSMGVLAMVALLVGASPGFALSLVVGSQAIRALWLCWKAHQSWLDVKDLQQQAVDHAKRLAQAHPVKQ